MATLRAVLLGAVVLSTATACEEVEEHPTDTTIIIHRPRDARLVRITQKVPATKSNTQNMPLLKSNILGTVEKANVSAQLALTLFEDGTYALAIFKKSHVLISRQITEPDTSELVRGSYFTKNNTITLRDNRGKNMLSGDLTAILKLQLPGNLVLKVEEIVEGHPLADINFEAVDNQVTLQLIHQ